MSAVLRKKGIGRSVASWRRLGPHSCGWNGGPADPDFFVRFAVGPDEHLRVRSGCLLAFAQRVARKPLLVETSAVHGGRIVEVTVGLTILHRLFGCQLDPLLTRLVIAEARDP